MEDENCVNKNNLFALESQIPPIKQPIFSLCLLPKNRLASSSSDRIIRIYNLAEENTPVEFEIRFHSDSVNHLLPLPSGRLLSSSSDHTMKLSTIGKKMFSIDHSFNGHKDIVWKTISINENQIASCSEDRTIKLWEINEPFRCIYTFKTEEKHIRSIIKIKDEDMLVSGSVDGTISWWNLGENKTLENSVKAVTCSWIGGLKEIADKIIVGGDKEIYIINKKSRQLVAVLGFRCIGYCLNETSEDHLLIGGCNGTFSKFNLEKYEWEYYMIPAHKSAITEIISLGEGVYASSSVDCSIKFWKVNSL